MYIGIDYLIDNNLNIYISEVNIGLPGGAQEYDYVYKVKYGKASGVFAYIESLCMKYYKKSFSVYLNELDYFNDLKKLKIWMDGYGDLPSNFPAILRLEDKWVQYLILSRKYPLIKTRILDHNLISNNYFNDSSNTNFVVKRRLGRGGKGFLKISSYDELKRYNIPFDGSFIIQPYINSKINIFNKVFNFSIRTLAFLGNFICMYANLSMNSTSNHGILFYISPGSYLGIDRSNFKTVKLCEKSWEASLLYKETIPEYLYHNLYEDEVARAVLFIPEKILKTIKEISSSISNYYQGLNYYRLPKSFIENKL